MRKLLFTLLVLGLIAGGIAVYLFATTPKESAGVRFPLSPAQRALVAQVPNSAESFALIPTAAALEAKLRANPITRDAIASYAEKQSLPRPWMLGGADLLVWREQGGGTRYFVKLDPFRATIVRMLGNHTMLINLPAGQPIEELDAILALTNNLPPGDALAVQRVESRGAFPPIERPTVTSVSVSAEAIDLTSVGRASARPEDRRAEARPTFPRGALLSAVFVDPPRLVEDLNRLFGTKVSSVLEDGGGIHIYGVKTGTLLPRPQGVIAVPANEARREALASLPLARTGERDGQLLLSFDDSLDTYLKDAAEPARWPAGRWALRADPQRLAPILRKLGDSLGLRVAAPRLYRSARDLERWLGGLEQASAIEAADSVEGSQEVLRVRITAK